MKILINNKIFNVMHIIIYMTEITLVIFRKHFCRKSLPPNGRVQRSCLRTLCETREVSSDIDSIFCLLRRGGTAHI